jgi:hypothetical protein
MDETSYDVRTLDPTKQCKYASAKSFNSIKSSYGMDKEFSFLFFNTQRNPQTNQSTKQT